MEIIINYLLTQGGIFGFFLALSISWIVWRETSSAKKKKDSSSLDIVIKNQNNVKNALSEISRTIDSFKEINKKNEEMIIGLQSKIQEVNDDRIQEIKEILQDYSKAMGDLSIALEKIHMVLEYKIKED